MSGAYNPDVVMFHADTRLAPAPDPETIREFLLDRALDYWRAAAGDRDIPAWRDIDLMELPPVLRRGTMVADFHPDRHDYFIRYWGTDLVDAFGIELSQQWLSESVHNGFMDSFAKTAHIAIETRAPQWLTHEITSPGGIRRVFPVVRLPLADDVTGLNAVMTVENIEKSKSFFAEQ